MRRQRQGFQNGIPSNGPAGEIFVTKFDAWRAEHNFQLHTVIIPADDRWTPEGFFSCDRPAFKYMAKSSKLSIIEWLLVAVIVVVLGVIALPNPTHGRTTAPINAIINNLRQIDGAKAQLVIEKPLKATNEISVADVNVYLKNPVSKMSIEGETYVIGKADEPCEAHLTHSIGDLPAGLVVAFGGPLETVQMKLPGEPPMGEREVYARGRKQRLVKTWAITAVLLVVIAAALAMWVKRRSILRRLDGPTETS